MAQHDNGRRNAGQQSGAWQQGQRDPQDFSNNQQDQSSGGRYGAQVGGGQQGGHVEHGGSRGHQDQYDQNRGQQGDNWRDREGPAAGGWRPAQEERDRGWDAVRGGQGSFGGQAADNDDGHRGVTGSGNFGNYGSQRDSSHDGALTRQNRYGQGGSFDQGGQRFGGYRQVYDARSDSTGGYGSSNYGPGNNFGSGIHGHGDWNDGSDGSRAGNDRGQWRGQDNFRSDGQSSADNYQGGRGWQGANNQDRYGDNGYQGNWQQGQRGQSYHDPDYHQWRSEQVNRLDRDYDEWRQHRYQRFSEDFDNWRANRDNNPAARASSQSGTGGQPASAAGDTSGQQGGSSKHDVSNGGDKGVGKTASK